jgi:hypothetical protein
LQNIFTGEVTCSRITQISGYEDGALIHLDPQRPAHELIDND